MRQLSKAGAAFNLHFEGLYLYAYLDSANVWTIGGGSTHYDGQGSVKAGDRISLSGAIARFKHTMDTRYVPEVLKALDWPLSQSQLDAASSFHYNTGAISSGTVDNKFNAGQDRAALATWRAYRNAGGKVLRGLERRRDAEIRLWQTGDYGNRRIAVKETPNGQVRHIAAANLPWPDDPGLPVKVPVPTLPVPLPERRRRDNFLLDIFFALKRWLENA